MKIKKFRNTYVAFLIGIALVSCNPDEEEFIDNPNLAVEFRADKDAYDDFEFAVKVVNQPLASLTTDQNPRQLLREALRGNLYFNVHTQDFPGGEIRGQLFLKSKYVEKGILKIELNGDLDAAQEPDNASNSLATGEATVIIAVRGRKITYSSFLEVEGIDPENLLPVAGVSSIHLHNAPVGVNGPVITDILQDAGGDINGIAQTPEADTGDGDVFIEDTDPEVNDDNDFEFAVRVVDQPLASLTTDQSPQQLLGEALRGNLYFNVHTQDFPGGEIRGQLFLKSKYVEKGVLKIELNGDLDAAQEPDNASNSLATGEATVIIAVRGRKITYSSFLEVEGIDPDNLLPVAGVSSIHLHNAPAGVNGPVITDILQDAGGDINGIAQTPEADTGDGDVFIEDTDPEVNDDNDFEFAVRVVDQPLASLTTDQNPRQLLREALRGNLYFNVHTQDFPGGEIRGQLFLKSKYVEKGVLKIELNGDLDAAQEPDNASNSLATGEATVIIAVRGRKITYSSFLEVEGIDPDNLLPVAGVSSIHLHNAPLGVNGPVITDILQDAGGDINGIAQTPEADTGDGDVFIEDTDPESDNYDY